ncbi:MAG: DNA primase [Candidatus Omnitrophica bacterium]|nr:DNA primase [Candidatus Omnitrophota bacterium]
MAGRIPENLLEDILSRIDIVEVISGYLPLKRAGRNFKACCPFHHEKTASFMVSPDRQIYHCFGCGESGNAFKFLMRYERMEFPEAVETLASKAGVILPRASPQDSQAANLIAQIYRANEAAALFYANNLSHAAGHEARNYLVKRGLTEDSIRTFRLGLALEKWDGLINHLRQSAMSLGVIEKAGLILPRDGGGFYDRFRNRIIFPISDIRSRVLGFGARVLDNALPKYMNSPETPIYTKGNNLYGLYLSRDHIRDTDLCVVVEGYLDFMIPYQHGLKNIVASQGTALTAEQIRLLKRYTHNVVMVYDGDAAGELATLRSLDLFIEEEMHVRVAGLPAGFDPDTFVRQFGIRKFKDTVDNAKDLFDYKLAILKSRHDPASVQGKARICQDMLETLGKFKNAVLKSEYIKKLAQEVDVREESLLSEIKKVKAVRPYQELKEPAGKKAAAINPTEKLLIRLMLQESGLIGRIREHLEPADFQDERMTRIASVLFDLDSQGRAVEPRFLVNHITDEDFSELVCESAVMQEDFSAGHKEKVVADCIQRLKSERLKIKKQKLAEEIRRAQHLGDEPRLKELMEEFHYLLRKKG